MQLRDYQLNSIQSIFTYYEAGNKGNPLVALPTGTGKSATIAGLICRIMQSWPSQRILVAAHAAELLKQNSATLERMWPEAPYGIYSAELRRKETIYPITFVGIGSVANVYASFGYIDVLIVDEAHLISDTEGSMYQRFIAGLKEINPNIIVVGFTATPYRMKVGLITDGTIFDVIVYDLTSYDNFNNLVASGYLAPLISRRTTTEYDISAVGTVAGEYNQKELAKAVSKSEITQKAVQELIQAGIDRNCGIIFAGDIAHAEEIAAFLRAEGESAGVVHSKQGKSLNDEILEAHRLGHLKWLVNKDKLTTGYDWPPLDICGMLRHTLSPGLWVQMLGRLTRPYDWMIEHQYKPGFNYTKGNALVLDFARNSERLGPVNDPKLPRKKGKGTGDAPIRICDACGTYNHASARVCDGCGVPFSFKPKISEAPSRAEVMKSPLPIVESYLVKRATYKAIRKPGSPPMLLAEYQCDHFAPFSEIVGIEAPEGSWQRNSSKKWWGQRLTGDVPTTVDDALRAQAMLKTPRSIKVHVNNMPRAKVLNAEF